MQAYNTDELVVLGATFWLRRPSWSDSEPKRGSIRGRCWPCSWIWGRAPTKCAASNYDIMVALLEEILFPPFADWLQARGMCYTEFCPNGKWLDMLGQTYHYGDDFFRYMRHYD